MNLSQYLPHPRRVAIFVVIVEMALVALWIRSGWLRADIVFEFRETGNATSLSILHLLLLTLICAAILATRVRTTGRFSGHSIWLLAAVGFLYLAMDEAFMWHERIDMAVHELLDLVETPTTDRLDDLIIALYGLVGITAILMSRRETIRYRGTNRMLLLGFVLLAVSVTLDAVNNDTLPAFMHDWNLSPWTIRRITVAEETAKLLAEAAFVVALYGYLYFSLGAPGRTTGYSEHRRDADMAGIRH